jgi:hypothetical protein
LKSFHFPNGFGIPDNPEYNDEVFVLKGEEINDAIIGKIVWWWGRFKERDD